MANISTEGSALGTQLQTMLMAADIEPGHDPSYKLCQTLYLYHPLGAKMVEVPIVIAQSQERDISIPDSPESIVVDAFKREWKRYKCDELIFNATRIKRIYGVSAVIMGSPDAATDKPLTLDQAMHGTIFFNILDPLNTAGSLVINQDPNAQDFQRSTGSVSAAGRAYHRSRVCVNMNGSPIYLSFSGSAYGYVGRSVYQRALFAMKSYVQTMLTNDLVIRKAGVFIAKMKPSGSIVDNLTSGFMKQKRDEAKAAITGNVISISTDEEIETLNLAGLDEAITVARKNIIEDLCNSADIPPKLLTDGYASVMANGSEDYKQTMLHIAKLRADMQPLYDYFDNAMQRRAWTPEFFATIQAQFPAEYGSMSYNEAFYQWRNSFTATWPSLMEESESDKSAIEKVKLDALSAMFTAMAPSLDPSNKARMIEWMASNINDNKTMFTNPLDFDVQELVDFQAEQAAKAEMQLEGNGNADDKG